MEYGFSILMLSFAALLLLYALILYRTRDQKMVPRNHAVKTAHPLEYARRLARVIAMVALVLLLSGIAGFFAGSWVPAVVLVLGLVAVVCLAVRMGKKDRSDE